MTNKQINPLEVDMMMFQNTVNILGMINKAIYGVNPYEKKEITGLNAEETVLAGKEERSEEIIK